MLSILAEIDGSAQLARVPSQVSRRKTLRLKSVASFSRGRGFWSLCDQGVVSAGNFATNILLARYLTQRDFGCFALLFDVMLILNSLTGAVIWYPLSVRGSTGGRGRMRRYTFASTLLTGGALVPLCAAVMAGAELMTHRAAVAGCAALALIAWQLQETARRGLTAQCRFSDAVWGDALSYPGQAILLLILGVCHRLSLESAFLTIAITSVAGFALQGLQVGLKPMRRAKFVAFAGEFWRSGRWMLLTSLAAVLSVQAFSWVLVAFSGLVVLADYQSLVNLLRIANPILAGICGIMLPSTARARSRQGMRAAWRTARHFAAEGAALLMPYYLILLIWPHWVMSLVYGEHSPYVQLIHVLRLYVAANMLFYVAQMIINFMSAIEETRAVFRTQCITMVATALVSLPLTACYGLKGVVAGVAMSIVVRFAATLYALRFVNWGESANGSAPAGEEQSRLSALVPA